MGAGASVADYVGIGTDYSSFSSIASTTATGISDIPDALPIPASCLDELTQEFEKRPLSQKIGIIALNLSLSRAQIVRFGQ